MKVKSIGKTNSGSSTLEIMLAFAIFALLVTAIVVVSFGNERIVKDSAGSLGALYEAKELLNSELSKEFSLLYSVSAYEEDGYEKSVHMEYVSDFSKFISVSVKPNFAGTPVKIERVVSDPSGLDSADSCSLVFGGGWENPNQSGAIYLGTGGITSVEFTGGLLYAGVNTSTGSDPDFYIVDVTDESNINILAGIDTGQISGTAPGLEDLVISGGYAYVANTSINAQLQVIDIDDPANPVVVSHFKLPKFTAFTENRKWGSVFYTGGRVYLGTNKSEEVEFNIIDVTDPFAPVWLGGYEIGARVNDIYVLGDTAFLATAGTSTVYVLDVGNPGNVSEISRIELPKWLTQSGKSIYHSGGLLYVGRTYGGTGAYNEEFYVFDSATLTPIGSVKLTTTVNGIFFRSGLAFMATKKAGEQFQVWQASGAGNFTRQGSLDLGGDALGMTCRGEIFYVAVSDSIKIIKKSP